MTYDLLVDKINVLLISNFFDANKAQKFPVPYVNAYQSKNQALVKISGFTMGEIGLASRL